MSAPKKVLIAEDSSVIQNLTKKILQQQDYEIKSVKNGQELLKIVESETFDVILLDINMPIVNGIECAKSIRAMADKTKAATPLIAITGNALNFTVDYFKSVGFNEYLQKPLNFDLLLDMVKKYTS
ncbi:MAG: response regulator [Bacteroidetes bacterium]|nr:MAG: response regulator [Bacteroidota bacterium]